MAKGSSKPSMVSAVDRVKQTMNCECSGMATGSNKPSIVSACMPQLVVFRHCGYVLLESIPKYVKPGKTLYMILNS
eukprot:6478705-Amphidinium_carterae.1